MSPARNNPLLAGIRSGSSMLKHTSDQSHTPTIKSNMCRLLSCSRYRNDFYQPPPPQNVGLVLSPCQNPITSPVSPTQFLTPLTIVFAMPAFVPLLCLLLPPPTPTPTPAPPPTPLPKPLAGSFPALIKLLPSPVAYSEPIEGNTFSPAESDTKSAKGTSQTQRPK